MTVELAFDDRGVDQPGTPLVLLHAFPLSRAMFDQVATELAQRRRVITPDLRGFGASPDPGSDEPALEPMADDVVALLDRLGVARCVLGGVSMGGY
ncbi:MAG: alpha/beta fold hydrolase, partial [Jiangellaceae bacterium]